MSKTHTYSTPFGPREIHRDGEPFAVIGKPKDAPQCIEFYNDLSAFGRMAAAAPDLLEALKTAKSFIEGFEDDDLQEGISEMLLSIRAAISKATP